MHALAVHSDVVTHQSCMIAYHRGDSYRRVRTAHGRYDCQDSRHYQVFSMDNIVAAVATIQFGLVRSGPIYPIDWAEYSATQLDWGHVIETCMHAEHFLLHNTHKPLVAPLRTRDQGPAELAMRTSCDQEFLGTLHGDEF